jgi:hypothetical protein
MTLNRGFSYDARVNLGGEAMIMRHPRGGAYVYFEEEPGWRSLAKLLTRDEARRTGLRVVVHFVTPVTSPTKIIS